MKDFNSFAFIGPVMLILFTVICSIRSPDYSYMTQYISDLATEQALCEEVMNYLGIIPFGGSVVLFSLYLIRYFGRSFSHHVGYIFLFNIGVLFLLAGFFRCEPNYTFHNMSGETMIHNYSLFSGLVLAILLQLYFGAHYFFKGFGKGFYLTSLITGLLSLVALYIMNTSGMGYEYKGLYQRLFILLFCLWLIFSGYFLRNTETEVRKS